MKNFLKKIILILLILCLISLAVVGYIIYNQQIGEIKGLSEDLQETHQSLKTAKSNFSEVNRENANLITKNKKLNEETALNKQRILKIEQVKEDLEREKNMLRWEKEELENTLTKTDESPDEWISRLEVEKEELERGFQEKLESAKERFGTEKEALVRQIKSAETIGELLSMKNKKLSSELDKSSRILAEYNADGAGEMLEKVKKELEDKISKLNKAVKENKGLTLRLAKGEKIINRLTKVNEKIEVQLAEVEQKAKGYTIAAINKEYLNDRLKNTKEAESKEKLKFHYNMGLAYDEGRRYKDALSEYRKALKFAADDPDVHYNLAIIYDEHLIDKRRAVKHFEAYLKLSPDAEDIDKVTRWISKAKEDLEWGK